MMKTLWVGALVCLAVIFGAQSQGMGQTTMLPSVIETLRKASPVQPASVTQFQLEQYLMARIPPLPRPSTPQEWSAHEVKLRAHIRNDIAFHGWPQAWINLPPRFEQAGVIESGHGYRIRKLRYEIVPGFMSTALLYEPESISGRVPAILNLIGHEPEGTVVEYEQKRCINFAKRGIVALNLGWMGFGDMSQPENAHDYAADLDLVGSNALGFFYLAMQRGLDYLATLPEVDPSRIGATGLSGGGWQTVVLSALDPRVAVSVEVAGIGSRESDLTNPKDTYEIEEDAPDLMRAFDYPELVAMRAPHPTMLIHNAVDSCCFRAPLVKPYIYDNVKPFFAMYGAADNLAWHENFVPGVHNYQLDNRVQAYRFFTEHFHIPVASGEIFSDAEIRTPEQLAIQVPANNQTILGLARSFAEQIHHGSIPAESAQREHWMHDKRAQLQGVVRFRPVHVVRALRMANSKGMDFQSLSYRFDLSDGLSATGIWLKQDHSPADEPVTIVLNDDGFRAAGQEVFDNLTSGHDVLAPDLLFTGATRPDVPDSSDWEVLVDSSGDRCLGLEAAQLLSIAQWLRSRQHQKIEVRTTGIRSQVIALVAAALDPDAFSTLTTEDGMHSLEYLLNKPVPFRAAADLFCLDLYKDFDIDTLSALASPLKITELSFVKQ
jgi:dienelactone hydrolase